LLIWSSGNIVGRINEVTLRWARLVLRWVIVCRYRYAILVCNQPPRSTQPGHPFMGRLSEYQ